MPGKVFELNDELSVTVFKRRTNRNVRLSIAADGEVRVSIPAWAPYKTGVMFAKSRQDWITAQQKTQHLITNKQAVGKSHHVLFMQAADRQTPTSRILQTTILIKYPTGVEASDPTVQKIAREACVKALRQQAETLLPQRLQTLAQKHDFAYHDVSIKRLKGRWGSCDHEQRIVLNLYLMQLSWDLIDYVLIHELTHTKILKHGPEFWKAMEQVLPNVQILRKQMRSHQPILS